ncbi:MAG: endonuclease MutS2, partial [Candidatus Limiplasma sp.]|nr:endonuclease MutS2 [Candidatus Limiplasma sp.]
MEPGRELRVLEFTKIRERLAAYCVTPMGAALCEALTPHRDFAEVSRALAETEEAVVLIAYMGGQPLVGCGDVREHISLAEQGAS